LRRIRPKHVRQGALVLIYISSPVQALAGAFIIKDIIEKPLGELWRLVHDNAGVTRAEYDEYFQGVDTGVSFIFNEVRTFDEPIKIQQWAEKGIVFRAPQGFRYATINELESLQVAGLIDFNECERGGGD
jgi:predicted transcriptional regulator